MEEEIVSPNGSDNATSDRSPEDRNTERPVPDESDTSPEIIAYRLNRSSPPLVCAPGARDWMDATDERFAYRCLPLLIANQAGWFILNPHSFEAMWDGTLDQSGVHIRHLSKKAAGSVTSHFGSGVITWHLSYLFRTPPGYNMLVRGPSNWPKDGVQALEGVVESDWTSATFTMNWKLTRTKHWVRFEEGEPICMLVPQRRGELEEFRTDLRDLTDNPELSESHRRWSASRSRFLAELRHPGTEAASEKWQKHYFQGRSPDGRERTRHQTVLTLRPFGNPSEPHERGVGARPSDGASRPVEAPTPRSNRPLRQPDYFLEKLDNEILLYHPGKTRALYLNEMASVVWELCNGERTADEIAELLREAFPEAAETIGDEVESTLRKFVEHEAVAFI